MKIKAVIMDGDGSTITKDNQLPDDLKKLINANPHIKWIMATGRSLDILRLTPIIDYLSTDVMHIVDGGSCLMDLNGVCKSRHLINSEAIDLLFSRLKLEYTNFLYYSPDGINGYTYSKDTYVKQFFKFHNTPVSYTNEISKFRKWVDEYPPGKILLNTKHELDLTGVYYHQNEDNYDITAQGINKGSACVELLAELALLPNEAVFIFNDKNDLPIVEHPMLKDIIKIKVGNQLPHTVADFHVATPHDVAKILENII